MAWECDKFSDLLSEISELGCNSLPAPPPPVKEYYAKMEENKKSSYIHAEVEPDELTYCISGRGRGGKRAYMAPGGKMTNTLSGGSMVASNDVTEELRQTIRATSGFAYSNEYIQELVRAKQAEQEVEAQPKPPPQILVENSPAHSKSSSPKSVRNTTPDIEMISAKSGTSGRSSSISLESEMFEDVESATESQQSPKVPLDENKNVDVDRSKGAIPKKPLPLSELLKMRKPTPKKLEPKEKKIKSKLSPFASPFIPTNLYSSTDEFASDSSTSSEFLPWQGFGSFKWQERNMININSTDDFPALK